MDYDLDDFEVPRRDPFTWALATAAVVVGLGVGGYFMFQPAPAPAAPAATPEAAQPVKVISATPVPPDTQGPEANVGGTEIARNDH